MFRKRVKHPTCDLYHFHHGRQLNGGALEFAFEPAFSLPLYSYVGIATPAGAMQGNPRPAYIGRRAPIAGLGGTQAGQYILQPLIDSPFSGVE